MKTTYPTHQSPKVSVTSYPKNLQKSKLKEIVLDKKIKLIIPKKVSHQIRWLCNEISEIEWSGILMYKLVGNFHTGNFHCVVKDVYPMNVGNSAYTEYEFDENFTKFRMENLNSLENELGHIHSHHSMSTFFSGTDMQELHDNSPNHNYYLSLIVNNAFEPTAKISFVGKQERKESSVKSFFGDNGRLYKIKENNTVKEDVLFIYNCSIEYDLDIRTAQSFKDRVDKIIIDKIEADKAAKAKIKSTPVFHNPKINNQLNIPYSEFDTMPFVDSYDDIPNEVDEEAYESMLICALEQNNDSKSTDMSEILFKAFQDYKVKKDKYITAFGNHLRGHLPLYLPNQRHELEQDEAVELIQCLYFYGEEINSEFVEALSMEILN